MKQEKELPKLYEPKEIENQIYQKWLESKAFHALPDSRSPEQRYVVMMPLPNVTGALHMGHAMDNVMQDLLIRWHRMKGDNTLWMPGTDHAGIATQAVIEKRLKELEGLTRHDVGREGLIQRIWKWKDQYQARIIEQQQRMGCSCDWERQRFTMDKVCARAVRQAFFRMFADGLIFRGKRLVNWDPFLHTTISDDEMYYETVNGFFWHLRYPVIEPKKGEPKYVVVATTRPETMLGDTAVAVHPDPETYLTLRLKQLKEELNTASSGSSFKQELESEIQALNARQEQVLPLLITLRDMALRGKKIILPLLERPIPLICDEWAKPDLGSGCVKITPAHDYNDYDVWLRNQEKIAIINILNPNGTLNENAGPYQGLDCQAAREKVVTDLERQGLLEKVEERAVEIGHSDRSKTPVEPFLSDQWFIKMGDIPGGVVMGRGTKKEHRSHGLVQAAIDAVLDGRVTIHPERYTKTYLDWLREKRDWPISRQLWWGHRIPVWSKEGKAEDFKKENLFSTLIELFTKRKTASDEIIVRIIDQASGQMTLMPGKKLNSFDPSPFEKKAQLRLEICLLEDSEDLINILKANGFEQDPDVLDTWFSSALWPFSTLGWPDPKTARIDPGQADLGALKGYPDCLEFYYPGSCLITARDIITLWVARMVLAGLYCLGDVPFRDVFIHANILDGKGVRMSKSKGNGIDPVDIIETYGTDAMRYVLCEMQTGTQDIRLPVTAVCPECGYHNDLGITQHGKSIFCYVCGKNNDGSLRQGACGKEFDVLGTLPELPQAKLISERFETGRAFCTKLWNSARFAFMNLKQTPYNELTAKNLFLEDRWILDRLQAAISEVEKGLKEYNPSMALNAARIFFWQELCDWYLELVKPRFYKDLEKSGKIAQQVLAFCLDQVLRLLHPFVPFITEHLWQILNEFVPKRGLGKFAELPKQDLLIQASWPEQKSEMQNKEVTDTFSAFQEIVRAIREVRSERNIPPKKEIEITIKADAQWSRIYAQNTGFITQLAGAKKIFIDSNAERLPGSAARISAHGQIFVHDVIDDKAEIGHLHEMLKKIKEEIAFNEKKLGNPQFSKRAPARIVEQQKEKLREQFKNKETIIANLKLLGVKEP
jgi:valyl-tRNA synthetase